MLRNQTKTLAGLVTLACTAALLSLPTESVGQDGHKDNTQQSYNDVMSAIQKNWADMRGGWNDQGNQNYLTLSKPEERQLLGGKVQVKMQYNFNSFDPIFGAYGTHSVLDPNKNHLKWMNHIKDPSEYFASGTIPVSGNGVNVTNTPWLSKAGELRDYLNNRTDQWELEKNPTQDGNVFQRAAQVSGMGYDLEVSIPKDHTPPPKALTFEYANNYIVEMWVDKDAIFRPNLHQSVDITQAGSFEAVKNLLTGNYAPNTTNPPNKDAWLPGLNGQMFDGNGVEITNYGKSSTGVDGFYDLWWDASFNNGTSGVPKNPFPWTGIGYTYDWYYQNAKETPWGDYWHTIETDGFGYGQGLPEYVMLQSSSSATPINFDIVNVQTTYEYMGGTNGAWGNLGELVPEPTTFTIFGMAALAGLGMHRRRRR